MHSVEKNIEVFNVNVGGTYSYQCVLHGYDAAANFRAKYFTPDDFQVSLHYGQYTGVVLLFL
jgi:hypothetical protein